jgi:hypothetical protein
MCLFLLTRSGGKDPISDRKLDVQAVGVAAPASRLTGRI